VTSAALPGHDPATSGCTDFVVEADVGELAPGYRIIVRGVCIDIEGQLWLHYAWTPGLTEPMGEDSDVWLNVEYGADVLPESLDYVGSYATDGGEFSEGQMGYSSPPSSAMYIWFDFYSTADEARPACRLTIDLQASEFQVTRS
jgi:hypothetical protein